jgi:hypothetical protein
VILKARELIGTSEVEVFTFKHDSLNIHLIDTPGFDDNRNRNDEERISDTDVLQTIAFWLNWACGANVKLSGIVYLHPINKNRMTGTATKNLAMFKELCGKESLSSVVLATTMWSKVSEQDGIRREEELKRTPEFWGDMIDHGSVVFRHDDTPDSVLNIVNHFLDRGQIATLQLQRQMVDEGMSLDQTAAGQVLQRELLQQKQKFKGKLDAMREEMQAAIAAGDERQKQYVKEQIKRYQRDLDECEKEHEAQKVKMQELVERERAKNKKLTKELESARQSRIKMKRDYEDRIEGLKKKMMNSSLTHPQRGGVTKEIQDLANQKSRTEMEILRLEQRLAQRHATFDTAVAVGAGHVVGQVAVAGIAATVIAATVCTLM